MSLSHHPRGITVHTLLSRTVLIQPPGKASRLDSTPIVCIYSGYIYQEGDKYFFTALQLEIWVDGLEEDGEGPVLWIIKTNEGGAQQGKYITALRTSLTPDKHTMTSVMLTSH